VLDSSCWIEYFADTERADLFAPAVGAVESLVVPVLTVYEAFKKTPACRWKPPRTACRWPTA
jgi:predicted nucleic acid-binding protein